MKSPIVSICIPTYKQKKYLRRVLQSIEQQTYKDFEVIVCDDSPTNELKDIIKKYQLGKHVKYIKNSSRLGTPKNWNEAIHHATGRYIKILHHDDWFTYKDSLKEFVSLLDKNPHVDLAFSSTNVVNATGEQIRTHCLKKRQLRHLIKKPEILFFGNIIGSPSATIYRKRVKDIYDVKLKWLVDIDFYIRLLRKNNKIAYSKTPLITTVTHATHNVTNDCYNNKEINIFEYFYLFNKIINNLTIFTRLRCIVLLSHLIIKFKIKSEDEIRSLHYSAHIPKLLSYELNILRIIPLVMLKS